MECKVPLTGLLSSLKSCFLNIISAFLLHLWLLPTAPHSRSGDKNLNSSTSLIYCLVCIYQLIQLIISFKCNNDTLLFVHEDHQPHCNWLRWFNIIDKHSEDTRSLQNGFYMSSPHVRACICGYQATGGPCEIWPHDKSFLSFQSIHQPVLSSVTSFKP